MVLDVLDTPLLRQSELLEKKEISSRELTLAYLDRIEGEGRMLNAVLTTCAERALWQAERADERMLRGQRRGVLDGIPFIAKDNISTLGVLTSCGSRMLENYIPPYDATVIKKLCGRGAVLLGKSNMDEFAMGSTGENSYFGAVKNPLDHTKVAGGSSSGSAACVRAGLASFALGSDTGGSIRLPAAYCGCVGLLPTYSTVSRYGLIAYASSFDVIGPICRSVGDARAVWGAIVGADEMDATSTEASEVELDGGATGDMHGWKIALPTELFRIETDEETRAGLLAAIRSFEARGAEVCEVSLPSLRYALSAYYIIAGAEASSNLARYDGVRYGHRADGDASFERVVSRSRAEGFGGEVKRRILLGNYVLSSGFGERYYQKALAAAHTVGEQINGLFSEYDLILSPTSPRLASDIGEYSDRSAVDAYKCDVFTVFANIAGIPAISVPASKTDGGLYVGIQLAAGGGREQKLFYAASVLEGDRDER